MIFLDFIVLCIYRYISYQKVNLMIILKKKVQDVRGDIIFLNFNKKSVNIIEIKSGYSRGGHYHKFESEHILISGKIEYREEDIETKKEIVKTFAAPLIIKTQSKKAHLITAITDTIFVELFDGEYEAINYSKYREIVDEKMKT